MRILGIDPGIAIVGYGLIEVVGNRYRLLEYGSIQTPSNISVDKRLEIIYDELTKLIDQYQPTEACIEKLFHEKNTKTFINVSQARGVEILACVHKNLNIYEHTPLQIKQALTGYGRATKTQVQQAVKRILNLSEIPKPDDAADALAIAISHAFTNKFKEQFRMR